PKPLEAIVASLADPYARKLLSVLLRNCGDEPPSFVFPGALCVPTSSLPSKKGASPLACCRRHRLRISTAELRCRRIGVEARGALCSQSSASNGNGITRWLTGDVCIGLHRK